MAENFSIAAVRHFRSGEHLEAGGHGDDAGYHYGVSAENAVKNAMREAGLEQHWTALGPQALRASPMRGHWALLQQRIAGALIEINLVAAGRRAIPLSQLAALGPSAKFSDWSIDIRYADSAYVPVLPATLAQWKVDALDFLTQFVN